MDRPRRRGRSVPARIRVVPALRARALHGVAASRRSRAPDARRLSGALHDVSLRPESHRGPRIRSLGGDLGRPVDQRVQDRADGHRAWRCVGDPGDVRGGEWEAGRAGGVTLPRSLPGARSITRVSRVALRRATAGEPRDHFFDDRIRPVLDLGLSPILDGVLNEHCFQVGPPQAGSPALLQLCGTRSWPRARRGSLALRVERCRANCT